MGATPDVELGLEARPDVLPDVVAAGAGDDADLELMSRPRSSGITEAEGRRESPSTRGLRRTRKGTCSTEQHKENKEHNEILHCVPKRIFC